MHRTSGVLATCCVFVSLLTGCGESDEIVSYTVPKKPPTPNIEVKTPAPVTPPFANTKPPVTEFADPATGPDRMLGAIIPRPDQAWFFKLTGPEATVAAAKDSLIAFLKTVEFAGESGTPKWTLPEGWKETGPRPMRLATLEFTVDGKPLELAISSLPSQADLDTQLLMNLNRWLGQMSLKESTLAAMREAGQLETIELPGGQQAFLANLRGKQSGGGMAAPFAR